MAIKLDPQIVGGPMAAVYKGLCRTLRYREQGAQQIYQLHMQNQPLIAALWHNELFPLPWFGHLNKFQCTTIVSQSKDGEFLAQILQRLGFSSARGSSRRGGVQALMNARKIMREENRLCVITVDGPKGPRHKPKEGVFYLAQKAGALIVPVRVYMPGAYVFKNAWDKFRFPYPFSRCSVHVGEAYAVSQEKLTPDVLAEEQARFEQKMVDLGKAFGTL
ncbi:MAG: lysophospholipid acyltransferase family protein [Desulfovibrio sp.]|uniref:lysophospholipid acyltransferase family protein n=1 Tax=Desulfovibrio sp. 7SRBS1 TaxID=3378064 RepID=UPI003B403E46